MRNTWIVIVILMLGGPAMAYVGQLDLAAGPIDTVRPTVGSVTVQTGLTISVAFSEAMLEPGITTAGNYALSGPGTGTLAATPSTVGGGGPYLLTWASGEMFNGGVVTVTVTGVQDVAGNAITVPNSGDGTGIGTPLSITIDPVGGSVRVDDPYTFTVVAAGGLPPLTYQWRKDGTDLTGATLDSLAFSAVSFLDAGDYVCAVSDAGTDVAVSDVAQLIVTAGMPVAGLAGLVLLAGALAAMALRRARRK